MSAASFTSGLGTLSKTYTTSQFCGAQTGTSCYNWLFVQGPYGGADPSDKLAIGDVPRLNDGHNASKQWLNVVKSQVATETLLRAGVAQPYVALAKGDVAGQTGVMYVNGDSAPAMLYTNLMTDKQVAASGAISHAPITGFEPPFASVIDFSNGTALKSTVLPGTPGAPVPVAASVGHCGTSGAVPALPFGGIGPALMGGHLPDQINYWGVPSGPGVITTLQPAITGPAIPNLPGLKPGVGCPSCRY
jgi:hypothetical protein